MSGRLGSLIEAWDALTCAVLGHRWSQWWEKALPGVDIRGENITEYRAVRTCARCSGMVSRDATGRVSTLTFDALGADLIARLDAVLVGRVQHCRFTLAFDAEHSRLYRYSPETIEWSAKGHRNALDEAETLLRQFREATARSL